MVFAGEAIHAETALLDGLFKVASRDNGIGKNRLFRRPAETLGDALCRDGKLDSGSHHGKAEGSCDVHVRRGPVDEKFVDRKPLCRIKQINPLRADVGAGFVPREVAAISILVKPSAVLDLDDHGSLCGQGF